MLSSRPFAPARHARLNDVIVSISDHHTLLIRFPGVVTLMSWAETIGQAYGLCQTIDPHPPPFCKGKEHAYD